MHTDMKGFTIIEVILFLAISGALAAGVLGSATLGINSQRYRDAATGLTSEIQEELTRVANPSNERAEAEDDVCPGGSSPIGASSCVVMGRLITVAADGQIRKVNVIGKIPSVADAPDSRSTDSEAITVYEPFVDTAKVETSQMKWGTTLIDADSAPLVASIVMLRSPVSGVTKTYTQRGVDYVEEGVAFDVAALLASQSDRSKHNLCLDPSGWVVSPPQAVQINSFTSGPNGVALMQVEADEC